MTIPHYFIVLSINITLTLKKYKGYGNGVGEKLDHILVHNK